MKTEEEEKEKMNEENTEKLNKDNKTAKKREQKKYKPLEFMDRLFKDYATLFPSKTYDSLFDSIKQDLISSEEIIEFSSKIGISNRLKNKEITSITQRGDNLYVGDSWGSIHFYY